jgi:hypothetical protein
MGSNVKVIIPGLAINLAQWLWPILDADERDYAILKEDLSHSFYPWSYHHGPGELS